MPSSMLQDFLAIKSGFPPRLSIELIAADCFAMHPLKVFISVPQSAAVAVSATRAAAATPTSRNLIIMLCYAVTVKRCFTDGHTRFFCYLFRML